MRAAGFEIGLLEWRAAKGDIRFFDQVESRENRWARSDVMLNAGASFFDIRRQSCL